MRPNLLIAGTQKGGTTWLHTQLAEHPDVFMSSVKELNYFHRPALTSSDVEWQIYLRNFEGATSERLRGESTPHYFWYREPGPKPPPNRHDTATAVAERLGDDLVVLVSLRDPVSRAVAAYWHNFAMGRLELSQSLFRVSPRMGLIDLGFYQRHWEHWAAVLGEERLRVVLFDDLVLDPHAYLASVLTELGLSSDPGFWERVDLLARHGERPGVKSLQQESNPIDAQEIRALLELYRDDITFVEKLTGRDLPAWRDLGALVAQHTQKAR